MKIRGQTPKLGALCRWVRDLDVVSGLAEQLDETKPTRSAREAELLVVLDAILRLTGPTDYTMGGSQVPGPIQPREAWDLRPATERRMVYNSVLDGSILKSCSAEMKAGFRVIERTPGVERKPPNLHPAILYASKDDTILLAPDQPKPAHHKHPVVPNLNFFHGVLSPNECTQIIAAGETLGFEPDAPIRAEGEENSILAHNFYWIVDTAFCSKLWSRVENFVPKQVEGKKVRGLNRRFRVYRYVPGAEYRAHIGKSLNAQLSSCTGADTLQMEHGHLLASTPWMIHISTMIHHQTQSSHPFSRSSYTSMTSSKQERLPSSCLA
jgi:hypothetical protein